MKKDKNGVELLELEKGEVEEVVVELSKDKNIEYITPNYVRETAFVPNDELINEQWAIKNVNAEKAWDVINNTMNLKEVKVAVIDTGIDMNHEDLKSKITDDGYDFVDNDKDPSYGENEEHATHVAGIIAASCDNILGVSGLSGKTPVKIMPIRVISNNSGDDFSISQGIYHAADNGADIINMSLGGVGFGQVLTDAVNYALNKGVVVIAAAHNYGMNMNGFYPAAVPGVVSVSATDSDNAPAEFTNYGNEIDVAAPGVDILSTFTKNKYEKMSGTSMATPAVSAVAAMIKSLHPEYNANQVEDIIYNSSIDLGSNGKDKYFGYGLIDLEKAMKTNLSENKLRIQDILKGKRFFNEANIGIKYLEPENLSSIEVYLDNILVDKIEENLDDMIINSKFDISKYKNGLKTVKVIAKDIDGNIYEDSVEIEIVNELTSGSRVRVTDKGIPVERSIVALICKDKTTGKYGLEYLTATDKNGYIDIYEEDIADPDMYAIISVYSDDEENYFHIKEMNSYGMVEFDKEDLVKIERKEFEGELFSELYGEFKFSNGEYLKDLKIYFNDNFVSKGIYKTVLASQTLVDNNEEAFLLSRDFELSKNNSKIEFDKENVAKVKLKYNEINNFEIEGTPFFRVIPEDEDIQNLIFSSKINKNELMFNLTPGEYISYTDILFKGNGYYNFLEFECEKINYKKGIFKKEFGMKCKSKVKFEGKENIEDLDKRCFNRQIFNKNDQMIINPNIRDKYNNTLSYVEPVFKIDDEEVLENGVAETFMNKIRNDSVQSASINKVNLTDDEFMKMTIKGFKGNIVQEIGFNEISQFNNKLPDDIKNGVYKLELETKYPTNLFSKIVFEVK